MTNDQLIAAFLAKKSITKCAPCTELPKAPGKWTPDKADAFIAAKTQPVDRKNYLREMGYSKAAHDELAMQEQNEDDRFTLRER
jgi:hypothetical protein